MRMNKMNTAGFTMIEIAISLGIIAFALVAIIGILPQGMKVSRVNREETIINQETSVLLNAICNGDQGLDDLTNYVEAITNTQTWFPYPGDHPAGTMVYGYTLTGSAEGSPPAPPQPMGQQFPLINGFRIVGLLSTPKYSPFYSSKTPPVYEGFYSNHVVATIRAMSGSAMDKAPQNNSAVKEMAFTYRMISEVIPYGSENSAWDPSWINYAAFSDWQWRSNYFRYAANLQADLNEVRLLFRWPALPNGGLGNEGRQVVRAVAAGPVQLFPNPTGNPAYNLYFVQPKTFVSAQ